MRRIDHTQILRVCWWRPETVDSSCLAPCSDFTVREVVAVTMLGFVRSELVALIGETAGADLPETRFPSDVLDRALRGCIDETDHAAAFFALGQPEGTARVLASDPLSTASDQTRERRRSRGIPRVAR